ERRARFAQEECHQTRLIVIEFDADHFGFGHPGERRKLIADRARIETMAGDLEHLIAPADQVEITVLVEITLITGEHSQRGLVVRPEKRIGLDLVLRIITIQVALHHTHARMNDFANLMRISQCPVFPHDVYPGVDEGATNALSLASKLRWQQGSGPEGLALPVSLENPHAMHHRRELVQLLSAQVAT